MVKLPRTRAFLVQFSDQTTPDTGLLDGRIEHVESGLRGRFASREELWAFIERVLAREAERNGDDSA